MRLALLVVLPGCLLGGGPVLAVRPKAKVALGYEVSGNLGMLGIEGGNTFPLNGGRTMGYFAARGTLALDPSRGDRIVGIDEETATHLNLMIGGGRAEGRGGLAAGVAPMMVWGDRECGGDDKVFTLTLGVRTVAGLTELYVAPKANIYSPFCFD